MQALGGLHRSTPCWGGDAAERPLETEPIGSDTIPSDERSGRRLVGIRGATRARACDKNLPRRPSDERREGSRGAPRWLPCVPRPVQLRDPSSLSSETHVAQNAWQRAKLSRLSAASPGRLWIRASPLWAARSGRRPSRGGNRVLDDFHAGGTVHRLFVDPPSREDAPGTTSGR